MRIRVLLLKIMPEGFSQPLFSLFDFCLQPVGSQENLSLNWFLWLDGSSVLFNGFQTCRRETRVSTQFSPRKHRFQKNVFCLAGAETSCRNGIALGRQHCQQQSTNMGKKCEALKAIELR